MKTLLIPAALAVLLVGCGERPQVIVYKQGVFQGSPDTHPSTNPPWNGDHQAWMNDIRARGQKQNEYKRIN
jgi:hypothetical protein